jgi:hypothetical protein
VLESLLSPPAPTAGQRLSEVTAVRSRTRCRTRCRTREGRGAEEVERKGKFKRRRRRGGVAEAPAHKEIRSRGSAMHLLKSRPHSDEATRFHARLDNAAAPKSLLDPWAALARLFYFHRREIPFADGKCAPEGGDSKYERTRRNGRNRDSQLRTTEAFLHWQGFFIAGLRDISIALVRALGLFDLTSPPPPPPPPPPLGHSLTHRPITAMLLTAFVGTFFLFLQLSLKAALPHLTQPHNARYSTALLLRVSPWMHKVRFTLLRSSI